MDYGRPSNFRASVYPTAQLNSPPSPPPARAYTASGQPLTPAMLRLLDKQKENQAFERIAQQAEGLKELFDKFGGQYVNAQEGSKGRASRARQGWAPLAGAEQGLTRSDEGWCSCGWGSRALAERVQGYPPRPG